MAPSAEKTIGLPSVVDLDSLDALREEMIDALATGPVVIAGAAVERVSTNGLFLLLSAAETSRQHDFDFAMDTPSPALLAAIDRLGLTRRFEDYWVR